MPDYVIQPGDNPWKLAERLYGEGRWAIEILRQNPGASWVGGTVISLPDQGSVKELQDSGFKPLITNEQAAYLGTGMSNFGTRPFDEMGRPTGTVPTLGGSGANTGGTGVGSTAGFANGRTLVTNPADSVRREYGLPAFSPQLTAAAGLLGGAKGTRRVAGQRVSPGESGMSTAAQPTPMLTSQDAAMRGRGMGRAPETPPISLVDIYKQIGKYATFKQNSFAIPAIGKQLGWGAQYLTNKVLGRPLPERPTIPVPSSTATSPSGAAPQPSAGTTTPTTTGTIPSSTARIDELYNAMAGPRETQPETISMPDADALYQTYFSDPSVPYWTDSMGISHPMSKTQFSQWLKGEGYTFDLTTKSWTKGSETTVLPDVMETPDGTTASGLFSLFDTPVWYSAITRMLSQSSGGGGGSSTGRSDTSMPYYAKVGGTTWNTGR